MDYCVVQLGWVPHKTRRECFFAYASPVTWKKTSSMHVLSTEFWFKLQTTDKTYFRLAFLVYPEPAMFFMFVTIYLQFTFYLQRRFATMFTSIHLPSAYQQSSFQLMFVTVVKRNFQHNEAWAISCLPPMNVELHIQAS